MKRFLYTVFLFLFFSLPSRSERIYIANSIGYNAAEPELIAAIAANGHIIDVNLVSPWMLPSGFTSRCQDPVHGYDWLLLFGSADYSGLLPQIKSFIDAGGKVFYQYEISCCGSASTGAAALLSGLTGLSIFPNVEEMIAFGGSIGPAWECNNLGGCLPIVGNAYKGLDGIPVANQFQATSSTGTPAYTTCLNFGFHFSTTDFLGTAHNGAITGLGDVNIWYDGDEPFSNGGVTPVNADIVDFFFPGDCNDTCFLFPRGCILETPPIVVEDCDIDLGHDTLMCTGDALFLNAILGGSSTYLWQDGSTGSSFTVNAPGLYWVEVNSPCCGVVTDSIVVTYVPGISFDLGNDTILCLGDTLKLDASCNGLTYLWQDGTTDSTYTVTHFGWYSVKILTACGTWIKDSIAVGYFMEISVDLGPDKILCPGQTTVLSALTWGDINYLWQDGSDSSAFVVTQPGEYWAQISNQCYTHRDTIEIYYIGPQSFDLGDNDTSLCRGDGLWVGQPAVPGVNYTWQDGSTASTYWITQPGWYWLTTQVTGCSYTDSMQVSFVECDPVVWMPNVFTPNGDGDNDKFKPIFTLAVNTYLLTIYDRWGKEIFSTTIPEEGWDGKFNGQSCTDGVYFWTLHFTGGTSDSFTGEQHGSLVLIR